MMTKRLALIAALLLLTGLTFYFPGHTYLQSDTQIYVPMMERAYAGDTAVLARDPMVLMPHTAWTLYDEITIGLRRLTGASFEQILVAEQFLFRAAGIWGIWMIAVGLGLSKWNAFFVAALCSLGAVIEGPAVLTIEYEPVPRGFAIGCLLLSMGFMMQKRYGWAAAAAALATVLHAPTAWPVWPALFFAAFGAGQATLFPAPDADPVRDLALAWQNPRKVLVPLGIAFVLAAIVLAVASRGQFSGGPFFGTIPDWLEQIQRMRARYNWISMWRWQDIAHYLLMAGLLTFAAKQAQSPRWLVVPAALGVLSMPMSWILLEQMKWSLMPQFQPARAVLWITLLSVLLCGVAAVKSEEWWKRALWLLPVFWIPVTSVLIPRTLSSREVLVVVSLAALFAISSKVTPAFLVIAFLGIPELAGVRHYKANFHTAELAQLSEWARINTPADSVFLFADAKHGLEPGVFRARSLRALYVDWKSGGQVNYFGKYAKTWKQRWDAAGQCEGGVSAAALGAAGVNYLVVQEAGTGGELVFRNEKYAVYRVKQ